ncbi:putative L-lactate dehydrogenase [cytochrome] 1 domain protein [Mycobacterium kansasii]|uniref:Putative L-lactate dehydrogenase [cytochrome] 1 domain protein n=1 Tax=Mycobacterium kansasii TaxID=1768 RepID=A0A1V3WA45_MYCKA|nr:putative L-lactate dehydrogenase [cytochrome] 1 domain protein [Mycobacterium kansasii]
MARTFRCRADFANRVQAVDPDGEVPSPGRGAAAPRWLARSPASRSRSHRRHPKIFFQVYWLGGRDAIAERSNARGKPERSADRHHRLVVLARARLGSPKIPKR